MIRPPPRPPLFPYTTLFRSQHAAIATHLVACAACRTFVRAVEAIGGDVLASLPPAPLAPGALAAVEARLGEDRKSTRLNSSHSQISYAVFCLKKKKERDAED